MYLSADEIKDIVLNVSTYQREKDDNIYQEQRYNFTTAKDVIINNRKFALDIIIYFGSVVILVIEKKGKKKDYIRFNFCTDYFEPRITEAISESAYQKMKHIHYICNGV